MSQKKIVGLVLMVLGIIGGVYSAITYANDTSGGWFGYTYEPPFTNHEIVVIAIAGISIIALIAGITTFARKGKV